MYKSSLLKVNKKYQEDPSPLADFYLKLSMICFKLNQGFPQIFKAIRQTYTDKAANIDCSSTGVQEI